VSTDTTRSGSDSAQTMARLAGVISAALALAVAELLSTLDAAGPSPIGAVGDAFIDLLGAQLKDVAVAVFGNAHKTVLVLGIITVAVIIGAWLGGRALQRGWQSAAVGYGLAGVIGLIALATRPTASLPVAAVAVTSGVAAGVGALALLLQTIRSAQPSPTQPSPAQPSPTQPSPAMARRRFIVGAGTLALGAGALGVIGRSIRSSQLAAAIADLLPLPRPTRVVPTPAGLASPAGISPYVTPIDQFFRIDTALRIPTVNPNSWTLTIDGMVTRPLTLSYDELLAMDSVQEAVTLACVSNEVGGNLVGNAVWQGVPLADLLERVGPDPAAAQIMSRSVDGFTAGFPTGLVDGHRTALVAYAMNGEPLPVRHGFPARLVVAGLYGYVSATKWLERIELTTWDGSDGYWIPRGWSKEGPVKITSRIDVPGTGRVTAGVVAVAGIALAPSIGIAAVEVQLDDGPWQLADLGDVASDNTWVQWVWPWDAEVGDHSLRVRAIDSLGAVQDAMPRPVAPDGATGLHTRFVRVVEA